MNQAGSFSCFCYFFLQGKQNSPIGCRIHIDVGICGDGEVGMAYGVGGSGAFGMVCDLAELIWTPMPVPP